MRSARTIDDPFRRRERADEQTFSLLNPWLESKSFKGVHKQRWFPVTLPIHFHCLSLAPACSGRTRTTDLFSHR